MKIVKTIKYETSDGQTFTSKERAMMNEANILLSDVIGEERKLTGAAVIDAMIEKPEAMLNAIASLHPHLSVQVSSGGDEPAMEASGK